MLGIQSGASEKEVQRAYRKLAKQYHPDANQGDAAAEERFKEISAANDVLGDPEKRKEYDEVREMVASGVGPGGFGGFGGAAPAASRARPSTSRTSAGWATCSAGCSEVVAAAGAAGAAGAVPAGPQRGSDLETELHLDFLDAVHGVTTSVSLTAEAPCSVCGGSGAKPGTFPETCPTCGGTGAVAVDQGPFSFSKVCPTCGGRGPDRQGQVQALQGSRRRGAAARGEGARSVRCARRAAHPREGARRARHQRRAARRPLRRGARRRAPDLRALRHEAPDGHGPDHVRGSGARRPGQGPDPRRAGHREGPARGRRRARPCGCAVAASIPPRASPATCS